MKRDTQTWTAVYQNNGHGDFLVGIFHEARFAQILVDHWPAVRKTVGRRVRERPAPVEVNPSRLAEAEQLLRDIVTGDPASLSDDKIMARAIARAQVFLKEGSAGR